MAVAEGGVGGGRGGGGGGGGGRGEEGGVGGGGTGDEWTSSQHLQEPTMPIASRSMTPRQDSFYSASSFRSDFSYCTQVPMCLCLLDNT